MNITMDPLTVVNTQWSPVKKFVFRFCFMYFLIYCFPFPLDAFEFTKPAAQPFYNLLDWFVPQIADKWFHLHAVVSFPMFDKLDDSNYGLAFLYLNIILSSIAALIWSLLDRNCKH